MYYTHTQKKANIKVYLEALKMTKAVRTWGTKFKKKEYFREVTQHLVTFVLLRHLLFKNGDNLRSRVWGSLSGVEMGHSLKWEKNLSSGPTVRKRPWQTGVKYSWDTPKGYSLRVKETPNRSVHQRLKPRFKST